MVEFSLLGVLLLVPLAYVLLAVFRVQDASYATAAAAQAAGRTFVAADDARQGERRATAAAEIALGDHHLALEDDGLALTCSEVQCLTPGSSVAVVVTAHVPLPFVPSFLGAAASVTVRGRDLAVVDRFR